MPVPPNEEEMTNEKIKEDWLAALDSLVIQLKEWTRPQHGASCPCCTPVCDIIQTTVEMDEEHIGSYSAPMLYLKTKNMLIELKPVGRFAIGAIGRVDMTNNRRGYSFLYSSRRGWVCMENRQPLTKSLFLKLFADLTKEQPSNIH
jgi:hypothetical protein